VSIFLNVSSCRIIWKASFLMVKALIVTLCLFSSSLLVVQSTYTLDVQVIYFMMLRMISQHLNGTLRIYQVIVMILAMFKSSESRQVSQTQFSRPSCSTGALRQPAAPLLAQSSRHGQHARPRRGHRKRHVCPGAVPPGPCAAAIVVPAQLPRAHRAARARLRTGAP
jgi:hypothetical protein